MTDRCDEDEAQRRAGLIMQLQERIMDDWSASRVGETLRVLCTGVEGGYMVGRSFADSPDIDGVVFFTGDCNIGDFVDVRITSLMDGEPTGFLIPGIVGQ